MTRIRETALLLRIQLCRLGGINSLLHGHDPRQKRRALGTLALCLMLVLMASGYSLMLAMMLADVGAMGMIPQVFVLALTALAFMSVMLKGPEMLFGGSDVSALRAMPVASGSIVASRMIALLAAEIVFAVLIGVPAAVVYGLHGGFAGGARLALALLLIPALPMAAALALGTLLARLTLSMRHRALLTAVLVAGGLLLRAFAQEGQTDTQALMLLALMAPLGLATTLLLPRALPIDALTMALTNLLCGISVVILYTVSPTRGVRQALFYAGGLAVMVLMAAVVSRVRHWKGLTRLAMVLGVAALALPLAFGEWNNGAKNWVEIPGLAPFQPSELVKLCVVLTLAYYFSAHRTVWQMMPAILFAGACLLLLMLQRDLGTALIYYLTTLVLFYAACGNLPLTLLGMAGGAGAAVLGYQMFAHVKVRVAMWKNPWSDPLDKGYQIIQALLAIGSGGLFGVGLGQGTPEKIPAYYNDFIFAVICEQMGLIFGLLVLAVYLLLIARGVTVITRARRSFDMLLGCGVLAMLAIQTLMIVGGVIKMIPLTGVTMPLMSYGGSSLISCLAMIGILHGISARAQDNLEEDILGA